MKGKLIVITGPSGVGKGTLIQSLPAHLLAQILFSISATTRSPRPGEENGREYLFMSRIEFETKRNQGDFLEWAEYAGNLYGTPRSPVEAAIAAGKIVILEIELEGARQVAQSFPQAKRIFVTPPSLATLKERLIQRGTDSETAIAKRLERAEIEVAAAAEFDVVIMNDHLDKAMQALEAAIFT